jgi:hypothetical protein
VWWPDITASSQLCHSPETPNVDHHDDRSVRWSDLWWLSRARPGARRGMRRRDPRRGRRVQSRGTRRYAHRREAQINPQREPIAPPPRRPPTAPTAPTTTRVAQRRAHRTTQDHPRRMRSEQQPCGLVVKPQTLQTTNRPQATGKQRQTAESIRTRNPGLSCRIAAVAAIRDLAGSVLQSEGRRFESGSRLCISAGEGDFTVSSASSSSAADHRSTTLDSGGASSDGPESERRAVLCRPVCRVECVGQRVVQRGNRWP